jgi:hypothetical protein
MQAKIFSNQKGFMMILAVLLLLAVTGGLALTLSLLSIGSNQSEGALWNGEQALFFSESCLEEGLLRIKKEADYSGGTFQLPEGECELGVEKNGFSYSITAVGKGTDYQRSLRAEALLDASGIHVSSWREE